MEQRATGVDDAVSPSPVPPAPQQPVGISPEQPKEQRPPEIAPIFNAPGVLTPRGSLVVEPSFQYSHSSSSRVVLTGYTLVPAVHVGSIDIRAVDRDAYVWSLAACYGLTNRLELEVKAPFVYQRDSTTARTYISGEFNDTAFDSDGYGIGDVEFGLRYQINSPTSGPFYITSLRVKSDTGKGSFDVPYRTEPVTDDQEATYPLDQPTESGFWGIAVWSFGHLPNGPGSSFWRDIPPEEVFAARLHAMPCAPLLQEACNIG